MKWEAVFSLVCGNEFRIGDVIDVNQINAFNRENKMKA